MKRRTALVAAAVAVIMKYKYQILWVICLIPVAVFVVLVWWQYFKPEAPRAVDPNASSWTDTEITARTKALSKLGMATTTACRAKGNGAGADASAATNLSRAIK